MGKRESFVAYEIVRVWGSHPRLRIWRQNTGKVKIGERWVTFGIPGQADWTGLVDTGLRIELETKTESGKQSEDQKVFQAMIERFNGKYILARCLEDMDRAMAEIGITR